ncbi:Heptahelical transmembrane protein 4 [Rhynchospora pubera]|uniref:Heptahelical transmembrane protein 4 n=1 Tax=Rhynchospora pubera TaxID=906938 RepID=A0AAV8DCI4_9POAL|nr:Heptahelical transmembrane protein 4 [Rhynchospora pubera]KAJ4819331.1 Heptahelical transmembrane protein 4 [Rhynchospora pubera]
MATVATLEKAAVLLEPLKEEDVKVGNKSSCCSGHKQKPHLVSYECLPEFLKHNEFIIDYYRSEWPLKDVFFSLFSVHNETLNVWTHLVGFFLFLSLTFSATTSNPMDVNAMNTTLANSTNSLLHINDLVVSVQLLAAVNGGPTSELVANISRWPFYAYLCGAMFCLLMSSTCHLLSCHSQHTSYIMLRLDYAGITSLIVTSFYPLVYYSFACYPLFQNLYITSITVFGIAAVLVSLLPAFEKPDLRWARAGLFACMGLSGLVPIIHKAILYAGKPEAMITTCYEMLMGLFYGLGVVVYATRAPERWMPGKFDLAGHSHQLFHILVIAGAYTHYLAGLIYVRWREVEGC